MLIWLKHVRFIRAWTTVALPQTILAINYPELIRLKTVENKIILRVMFQFWCLSAGRQDYALG